MMHATDTPQTSTEPLGSSTGRGSYDSTGQRVRQITYVLLIVLTAGMVTGRILSVTAVDVEVVETIRLRSAVDRQREQLKSRGVQGATLETELEKFRTKKSKELRLARPFLSANDRSRWCTIRALVDEGTYAIDRIVTDPEDHARWQTIDMVKHANSDNPIFIVDRQLCLTLANHKPDLARDMLSMLISSAEQDREALPQLLQERRFDELSERIHKLYGSSCYSGVPALKDISGRLDKLLLQKQHDNLELAFTELNDAIAALLEWNNEFDVDALFGCEN